MEKAFEVADGAGEIDSGVHPADDGFVCVDYFAYCFGEVVWSAVTEYIDDLFSVADRELDGEVFEGVRVVGLCQAPFKSSILENSSNDGDGITLAVRAYLLLFCSRSCRVCLQLDELVFA